MEKDQVKDTSSIGELSSQQTHHDGEIFSLGSSDPALAAKVKLLNDVCLIQSVSMDAD